nr:LuxR C-terminal-related transcriptional regulator [Klebsiella pneumoniae]
MFAGKKSAQIREILISESAWEEMTCLFAPSLSAQEVLVLDLLLAEKSVKEIAQELQMAEKRIYAIKLSLQNKMGGRGKLNIILSG